MLFIAVKALIALLALIRNKIASIANLKILIPNLISRKNFNNANSAIGVS